MLGYDRVAIGVDAEGVVVGFFWEGVLDVGLGLLDDIGLWPNCGEVDVDCSRLCLG